ncbi:SMAD/FHA domain-containing protein [Basidiobolus meristosporus CBS 931.73]|uniref:SMAD/FHA domain-containing protein n=1 Tax=Basidiobolus meristosporus CBS 931.73 TaxID=1314790 RepID=A0A1Y1YDI5_9FUNG|nr:SMAD/FHA domain-containing protein [Basidiobolus meristosporus CBS 931.73]|eukprot:ORX96101.1 SMAD/FHA domain-containing protein [Basidiobolus meristosporus CBS 931.73]
MRAFSLSDVSDLPPTLVLESLNGNFQTKKLELFDKVKIGRQVSAKTCPEVNNGYFNSKVLSRTHAEVWLENGQVYIKDLKSSNGTYLNNCRLSPEGVESQPFQLKNEDLLDFGVDILETDNTGKADLKPVTIMVKLTMVCKH